MAQDRLQSSKLSLIKLKIISRDQTYLPYIFNAMIHMAKVLKGQSLILLGHNEDVLDQALYFHQLAHLKVSVNLELSIPDNGFGDALIAQSPHLRYPMIRLASIHAKEYHQICQAQRTALFSPMILRMVISKFKVLIMPSGFNGV